MESSATGPDVEKTATGPAVDIAAAGLLAVGVAATGLRVAMAAIILSVDVAEAVVVVEVAAAVLPAEAGSPNLRAGDSFLLAEAATARVIAATGYQLVETDVVYDGANVLGTGSFGIVYGGTWQGLPSAIKRVFRGGRSVGSDAAMHALVREVVLLSRLRHPHILPFYGAVHLDDGEVLLVTQRAACSVDRVLYRGNSDKDATLELLTEARALAIAVGIARALAYLHSRVPPVAHGDIKSANVLLDIHGTPLLADFGLARTAIASLGIISVGGIGTMAWLAPELFDDYPPSAASDMYSFGCLLYELFVRTRPWAGCTPAVIVGAVSRGRRPELPPTVLPELSSLIARCWLADPASRPSAFVAVRELLGVLVVAIPASALASVPSDVAIPPPSAIAVVTWALPCGPLALLLAAEDTQPLSLAIAVKWPLAPMQLTKAATAGDTEGVTSLLQRGANVDEISEVSDVDLGRSSMLFFYCNYCGVASRLSFFPAPTGRTDPPPLGRFKRLRNYCDGSNRGRCRHCGQGHCEFVVRGDGCC